MASERAKFPIVGLGASAGGIPALEGFFKGLPDGSGMGFIIVTHLSPERESLLHEVIGRYTSMTVKVAEDKLEVLPETVYVMPPNALLTIDQGTLQIRKPNKENRERKPIDIFFSALAKDQAEYAVGVVLSGGDGDGTLGVKAIKENNGLTMAQTSDGASGPRNPDMPRSAIASGLIDIAAPAEDMGSKLISYMHSFDGLRNIEELVPATEDMPPGKARDAILSVLRSHSGHDFSGYKTKTFFRRIKRRMQLAQLNSVSAYVDLLQENSAEARSLFSDLLINVTNFFRDAEAFTALGETIVPRLFAKREAGNVVRIWMPGCATGEEVYSIAILLREHMDALAAPPNVQIFATDIDQTALQAARAARYPEALLEGVSSERRRRFFKNDGPSYVLRKEVREMCIFSPHNVIRDPPFSRMDMVSCRNLLIYFGQEVQQRILPIFHYALKPGGYLFLGMSESIGEFGDLFATVDKKHRLFQAIEQAPTQRWRALRDMAPPQIAKAGAAEHPRPSGLALRQTVEAQIVERYSPAHVVVNAEGDVVYYSAKTGRFLEAAQGAPTRQLALLVRPGLRLAIRAALREVAETRRSVVRAGIAIEDGDEAELVTVTAELLPDNGAAEPQYLVLFETQGPGHQRAPQRHQDSQGEGTAALEAELRDTRERLQSTIEEYETALEELKSSNEELVSVNEEAQSTNEELEASKEEMQSLNEELNTINLELTKKVEDLDQANSDLSNLFESTRIATVFLDRNLVIRNFTPAASAFFALLPADVGRPLTDLSTRLDYPELKQDIAAVFAGGEMVERRIAPAAEGQHYLSRLIPYRGVDDGIEGVVVTFVDITSLAKAQEHQKTLISELNHRVKNMLAVVSSIASHTLVHTPSPQVFSESFMGRLASMGRAYALMTRENWSDVSIEELIRAEIEPFDAQHFRISGPMIRLPPEIGLSLAMVIFELATNASKYGALSTREGAVEISWAQVPQARPGQSGRAIAFDWQETGGPPVSKPQRKGFGLSLVEGEIGYQLGGKVETSFRPEGLRVKFSVPVTH